MEGNHWMKSLSPLPRHTKASSLFSWQGVVPTAQRAAIVVGVELPVYDITKKHLILSGLVGDTVLTHFM